MEGLNVIENLIVFWWWAVDTKAFDEFMYLVNVVGLYAKYTFEKVYNKL